MKSMESMESMECTMDNTHYILWQGQPMEYIYGLRSIVSSADCDPLLQAWIHYWNHAVWLERPPLLLIAHYHAVTTWLLRRYYRWLHRSFRFMYQPVAWNNPDRSGGVYLSTQAWKYFHTMEYVLCTVHTWYDIHSSLAPSVPYGRPGYCTRYERHAYKQKICLRKTCHESVCRVLSSV